MQPLNGDGVFFVWASVAWTGGAVHQWQTRIAADGAAIDAWRAGMVEWRPWNGG